MESEMSKKEISYILERFLVRELGEHYPELIDMEYGMSIEAFKNTYLKWDWKNREWVSLI